MKKDQINILKDRGIILVSGKDSKEFLQNIITNDINIVNKDNSIFSGIFTPQGKYLYEFFIVKSNDGYFLDCSEEFVVELKVFLEKFISFWSKILSSLKFCWSANTITSLERLRCNAILYISVSIPPTLDGKHCVNIIIIKI